MQLTKTQRNEWTWSRKMDANAAYAKMVADAAHKLGWAGKKVKNPNNTQRTTQVVADAVHKVGLGMHLMPICSQTQRTTKVGWVRNAQAQAKKDSLGSLYLSLFLVSHLLKRIG